MKDDFKLNDIPKHNIYQVPENYFDRLPMRVMERTAAAPTHYWQVSTFWKPVRIILAPLVLLLVFIGVFYLNVPSDNGIDNMNLATLQNDEIMEYLSTYAVLETNDFVNLNTIEEQEMTAEFLNISATTAEEELEYYNIKNIDY
jgi:hypothetical protein